MHRTLETLDPTLIEIIDWDDMSLREPLDLAVLTRFPG
jgi:hypothetical protein